MLVIHLHLGNRNHWNWAYGLCCRFPIAGWWFHGGCCNSATQGTEMKQEGGTLRKIGVLYVFVANASSVLKMLIMYWHGYRSRQSKLGTTALCLVGILKPIDQWTVPKRCLGNTKETPQFWIHHFESHFVSDHGHGHILVRVHQSVSQGLDHWDLDAAGAFHPSAARPFFTRCARCAASCAAPEASFTRKERQREATAGRTNQEISINMS